MTDSKKKRTLIHFNDELKREAETLYRSSRVSPAQVSEELGIVN